MKLTVLTLSIILATMSLGCSLRGVATSVPPRIFREVHGLRVRSYQITPVTDDLHVYKAIEVHHLENLMLEQIPESSVKQLDKAIAKGLLSLKNLDISAEVDELASLQGASVDQSHPEVRNDSQQSKLVLEGYIDDYTPGIPKLRYIEQGNNHAVLTIRVMLKDKQTSKVLGEMNITVENTRITSNVEKMVEKAATEVVTFVDRSTTRHNNNKEVTAHVQ